MQELVQLLIDKAAKKVGSKTKLAKRLGVTPQRVNDWRNGKDRCMPTDMAAIGFFAGYNATNLIASATIAMHDGTPKGEVLKEAFGPDVPTLEQYLLANRAKKIRCVFNDNF